MRRTTAVLVLVLLLAAACSATNNGEVTEQSDTDATTTAAPGAKKDGAATSGLPGGGGTGGGDTRAANASDAPVVPGNKPGTPGGLPKGTGSIKIGIHYSKDLDAAYRVFGASGEFFDVEQAVTKMVAYVNARGGLGGKKIVPVFHGTDPLNGTFPEQAERACAFFGDDQNVAYVVSGAVLPDDNMMACHHKRNIPLVWSYHYMTARDTFAKYPNLYMPHMIGTHRMNFYIDALKQAGYFDKGAKVALIRYDSAVHKEFADKVVKPGLARIGMKLAEEAAIKKPQSAGEAGDAAAQISSAILRFRNAGVSHVLFSPSGGAIPLIWGATADSQNYFPRHAFTSLDIPPFVTDNMSAEQLDRALVVGWMSAEDTYMQYAPKTPQLEECKKASGIKDDNGIVRFCDGLFFIKAALDKTPLYDVAGLRKAVEILGTSYKSPWTITTRFGPGRHDGATSYRMLGYQAACTCFKFVSGPKAIP